MFQSRLSSVCLGSIATSPAERSSSVQTRIQRGATHNTIGIHVIIREAGGHSSTKRLISKADSLQTEGTTNQRPTSPNLHIGLILFSLCGSMADIQDGSNIAGVINSHKQTANDAVYFLRRHDMKTYKLNGGTTPRILKFSIRWVRVVSTVPDNTDHQRCSHGAHSPTQYGTE